MEKPLTRKSNHISHYSKYIWILLLISVIYGIISRHTAHFIDHDQKVEKTGTIISYEIDGDLWKGILKTGKEKYQFYITIASEEEKNDLKDNVRLGMKVTISGIRNIPSKNGNKMLFQYRDYLRSIGIFYQIEGTSYKIHPNSPPFLYKVKEGIYDNLNKANTPYLQAFLFGNLDDLGEEEKAAIQKVGIQHLFSVSGLHFQVLIAGIRYLITCKNKNVQNAVILFIVSGYSMVVGFTPSVLRVFIFFLLQSIKDYFQMDCSTLDLFCLTLTIVFFMNPWIIYHVGFQFSFGISFFLIYYGRFFQFQKGMWWKLPVFVFFVSAPISMFHFYELNFLSPIFNMVFVPFVTMVLFPCALITLVFFPMIHIFQLLQTMFQSLLLICARVDIGIAWFAKPTIDFIVIYYVIFFYHVYLIRTHRYYGMILLPILLGCHYMKLWFSPFAQFHMIDVGQGDASFFILPHSKEAIMIDTGGRLSYKKEDWQKRKKDYDMTQSVIIPYLKAIGATRISTLIISHGDHDHMGEAVKLVNNIKVEKVIFNCGEFNGLEQEFIKVLDKRKIPYYSCIKELKIDHNKLYFLQTKEYDNENDNSNVIYTVIDGYKFMFMGDAGVEREKDILGKYNISDIDVLKVGHHGSKTSSSKNFIDAIDPKYSIISVGKNNRYGHPNKEVLDNLENSKIYRTDQNGSIMIKIKKNKLKIETCNP